MRAGVVAASNDSGLMSRSRCRCRSSPTFELDEADDPDRGPTCGVAAWNDGTSASTWAIRIRTEGSMRSSTGLG